MITINGEHFMVCPMCRKETRSKWHLTAPGIDMMVCIRCHSQYTPIEAINCKAGEEKP